MKQTSEDTGGELHQLYKPSSFSNVAPLMVDSV